jgi:peptide/nickel transport system permease protein
MVIYRHILPNGLTPVLVTATFGVAAAILTESTLSFLGLGLIDEPSWGQMLNQARSGGQGFVWWMAIFPGAAIFLTVYAYALIGDSIRDAIDPKLRKRD